MSVRSYKIDGFWASNTYLFTVFGGRPPVVAKESPPEIQSELVRVIATRGESTAMNELINLAKSKTPEIRKEAFRGIGILADQSHLDQILMRC